MSIHPSLRGVNTLIGERSVFTRKERLLKLIEDGRMTEDDSSTASEGPHQVQDQDEEVQEEEEGREDPLLPGLADRERRGTDSPSAPLVPAARAKPAAGRRERALHVTRSPRTDSFRTSRDSMSTTSARRRSGHGGLRLVPGRGPLRGGGAGVPQLAGCPLRCAWCDTPGSWDIGEGRAAMVRKDGEPPARRNAGLLLQGRAVGRLRRRVSRTVSVTGGEPLLWPGFIQALRPMIQPRRLHRRPRALTPRPSPACSSTSIT